MTKTYQIYALPGDGIGPEILDVAVRILTAVEQRQSSFKLELHYEEAGAGHYLATGEGMSDETYERIVANADAVLKGPAGLPHVRAKDGTEAGVIGGRLRNGLDLYANVRPVKLLPGVPTPVKFEPGQIDYVIVRENTEGLYASRGNGVANERAAVDMLFMTKVGVQRVVRAAFELARRRSGAPLDGVKRVTCVDKANVLKSMAFWRQTFTEVAEEYPDVATDYMYADAAGQAIVMEPSRFDVLVMENYTGDLLSDVGGGTVGGLGMCPSGNLGDTKAYFEPIHGSAPSIAGTDSANPLAQVLSAALMLDWLGEGASASLIERAVSESLSSGALQVGTDGALVGGTRASADVIIAHL